MEMMEAKKPRVMMLRVSHEEALALIQSLANQLVSGSPNAGRLETFLEDGRDFSISVITQVSKSGGVKST